MLRDSLYSGIAGLAFLFAEVSLTRPLTQAEQRLLNAVLDRLARTSPREAEASLYYGAAGIGAALFAFGDGGAEPFLRRLASEARADGWRTMLDHDPEADYAYNDVLLGTAGVVMAGLWTDSEAGLDVAARGADSLLLSATITDAGLDWAAADPVPFRMPNYSHGTAGCAAALAVAGEALARPALVEGAVAGGRHLVSVADMSNDGFQIAHYVPERDNGEENVTYSWCHGPAGTSLLFAALDHAGVDDVSGFTPVALRRRALRSVLDSGIPQRLRPGFWDNDGRCCGTAGVGDVLLDAAQDESEATLAGEYLAAATVMADALLERAVTDGTGTRWRFIEHRKIDSLLPPGTGWMQGAAGIAAYLLRMSRVLDEGLDRARVLDRPDQWWAVPARLRTIRTA